jgi:protocatechuate 3,4-dioxygenase beta subunit
MLEGVAAVAGLGLSRLAAAGLPATSAKRRGPLPARAAGGFDNDLIHAGDARELQWGAAPGIGGRILDRDGGRFGQRVEYGNATPTGVIITSGTPELVPADENFQGYGQTLSDATGAYHFRTIRPVPYPGRTPHIHFTVSAPGVPHLTTQMYVAGEPQNEHDFVLMSVRDPTARSRLIVPLRPASEPDVLSGTFDIVLG